MTLLHHMVQEGTISTHDLDFLFLSDDVEEVVMHVQELTVERFGLRPISLPKRSWLLRE